MKQTGKFIFLELIIWCLVLILFIVNCLFLHEKALTIYCLITLIVSSIINTVMVYKLTSQTSKNKDDKTGDASVS